MFTLKHNVTWLQDPIFFDYGDLLKFIEEPNVHHPIPTEGDPKILYTTNKACSLEDPWALKCLATNWNLKHHLDIRLWKDGLTALNLAILRKHDGIVRLLKPLAEHAIESDTVLFENYLLDLLEVSSVKKAEEELNWMIEQVKTKWGVMGVEQRLRELIISVEGSFSSEEALRKPARTWMRVKEKLSAMEAEEDESD
ncbi:MAG: hypothetical protein Q9225_001886 [Loekoesia sp. 1 TL-2023]